MLQNERYEPGGGTLLLEREPQAAQEVWAGDVIEWVRENTEVSPLVKENYMVGRANRLWLKREDELVTGSFKQRGAYVMMRQLAEQGELKKVVTASAGNHAQGVARAASLFGVEAEVHLPFDTPEAKLEGIAKQGGKFVTIVKDHDNFTVAKDVVLELAAEDDAITYVPAYENEFVMAGQGTVGLEILEQAEAAGVTLDKIFVPVGGGGLLAGVAEAVKRRSPNVQVIGVQMEGNDSAARSFRAGERVASSGVDTLCDGTAVSEVGESCFEKIKAYVDDIIVVRPEDIGEAYFNELRRLDELAVVYGDEVYEDLREPAGMLAETGAVVYGRTHPEASERNWAAVASGGNVDYSRVDEFVERYLARNRVPGIGLLGSTSVSSSPIAHLRRGA